MTTQVTTYKTTDGLTVYDLDVYGSELTAVAGPAGCDPATIDTDELPEGFRWVSAEEWEALQNDDWSSVNTHRPVSNELRTAVDQFFGDAQVVYATPDTPNHSANFYGDTQICELTKHDVANLIQIAHSDWQVYDEDGETLRNITEAEAIEMVLADLQTDRPE